MWSTCRPGGRTVMSDTATRGHEWWNQERSDDAIRRLLEHLTVIRAQQTKGVSRGLIGPLWLCMKLGPGCGVCKCWKQLGEKLNKRLIPSDFSTEVMRNKSELRLSEELS
ncbi:hypothetical protein AMECASPLE_037356 [Ameca splendens]|uniref:Uncharacterized protein n=1 Tax=Ameca splendens TaxID=208324 RepID=A0ABV0ZJ40_9TELE